MNLEFWYLLPISIVFATIAMASGVEGATFFTPLFILALGLTPEIAIGTGLITEVFGFGSGHTALVITDPQNDFLSPEGVTWAMVGESVTQNNTVENIESLLKASKANDLDVFISPHYYYPTDHGWKFEGTLEKVMHSINMFDRKGALDVEGFEGSGADWLELYKPYINDGKIIVASSHKVYGPKNKDLMLQLRKRKVDKVILCGMSANLCTESHMRELLERGFEVAVVKMPQQQWLPRNWEMGIKLL